MGQKIKSFEKVGGGAHTYTQPPADADQVYYIKRPARHALVFSKTLAETRETNGPAGDLSGRDLRATRPFILCLREKEKKREIDSPILG